MKFFFLFLSLVLTLSAQGASYPPSGGGNGTGAATNVAYQIMTNFVLNTTYTNTSGGPMLVSSMVRVHTAAVNGDASIDLMVDQAGGTTFIPFGGLRLGTTVAVTLAMDYTNSTSTTISNLASYYWTNSSAGAGNVGALIAGTASYTALGAVTNFVTGSSSTTDTNGVVSIILTTLTNSNPTFDGNYQNAFSPSSTGTQPNKLVAGQHSDYRNAGAAFSGIYSRMSGGSAAALSDTPARNNEIYENKTKPYFVISTRQAAGTSIDFTKISTVTNLVNTFVTNGYVQLWTNTGVRLAMILEDGMLTNYRSSQGLLSWNTNRFPLGSWVVNGGTTVTNVTTYIRTNGLEPWLMFYATALVPAPQYWPAFYSITYTDPSGNTEWDNSGANPFGGTEYITSLNPESAHRDISSLYANDFAGVIFQHAATSAGMYNQVARLAGYAALHPYYFTPDLVQSVATDGSWINYSPGYIDFTRHASHPMFLGMMMGPSGPWEGKFGSDFNTLITESNDGITPPAGSASTGVGWCMSQIKWESSFITNTIGYCHPTLAGDGFTPNSYTYTDWYSWASVMAFFNVNPYLMGNSDGAFPTYQTGAAFTSIGKNQNWIKINQDVTGNPPICISLNTNNSIWYRKMTDGSKLVLMENEAASTTNLTVTAAQLGISSNTIITPVDAMTNVYLGLFTNTFTWTVPIRSAFLFKIPLQILADSSTNNGQLFWDNANSSTIISGVGNLRAIRIDAKGNVVIGTNDPPLENVAGNGLTVNTPGGASSKTLTLIDASGAQYDMIRSGVSGNWRIIGAQGNANSGLDIESSSGIVVSIGGATNWFTANMAISNTAVANQGTIQFTNAGAYFPSNVAIGQNLSVAGGTGSSLGGSNFISSLVVTNLAAITNLATMSPDFSKLISLIATNNAFQVLGYGGKDSSGKDVNWCTIAYTNSAGLGSAFVTNITFAANTHVVGQTTLNLTNWTEVLYEYWSPNGPTNAVVTPYW